MSSISLERTGGVTVVRLERPARSNSIDLAMIEELERTIDRIDENQTCRVIVLTGAGGSFCAGGDLDYFASIPSIDDAAPPAIRMGRLLDRLGGTERVTIGAVNGAAVGGGCEMALACHLRVASESATFSMRHRDLGMSPGWGGGVRLFETVAPSRALWMLLTASTLDAADALDIGLVHRVVPADRLMPDTLALAHDIASRPRGSINGFLKLAAAFRKGHDREPARRDESRLFSERWQSVEFQELLAKRRRRNELQQ
jgi:enoyl-CoA hydratase/carnithine racemase